MPDQQSNQTVACEHFRIRCDNTGSEQRRQCADCKVWGHFEFEDPTEDNFTLNSMRFVTERRERNA